MKKLIALLCLVTVCIFLCACDCDSKSKLSNGSDVPNQTTMQPLPTVSGPKYGVLQEIVDSYGFPIYFRMTEGMELTEIILSESMATREWMSSLVTGSTVNSNIEWSISGDHLILSGEWEEEFTINIEAGRAYSKSDGKEYRIVTYDDDGEVEFYVE